MKKLLIKIIFIFFMILIAFQNFCYADVAVSPLVEISSIIWQNVVIIGVAVFIVSVISLFILHKSVKNNDEKKSEKSKKISNRIYIFTIILTIIILSYFQYILFDVSIWIFRIPILTIIISILLRNERRKLSNILCVISVILVCVITLYSVVSYIIISNYNEQFYQYEGGAVVGGSYVSDVEGLINTAIENNKNGRKVTLIYENISYTSMDELKQLLSKLNTNKEYSMSVDYDKNYKYIESITLSTYYRYYNY